MDVYVFSLTSNNSDLIVYQSKKTLLVIFLEKPTNLLTTVLAVRKLPEVLVKPGKFLSRFT